MEDYNKEFDGYIGIDEVARGNFFGPSLFVGCDLKVPYTELSFAVDSKTTKKEQRKRLFEKIKDKVEYHLVEIPPSRIDDMGLSKSIKGALEEIINHFGDKKYLYDGKAKFGVENENLETLVKADGKVISVSCASIIAKYHLDLKMEEFDKKYPEYGFLNNAGYATKAHIQAVKDYGFLKEHRMSYNVKELEYLKNKDTTDLLF